MAPAGFDVVWLILVLNMELGEMAADWLGTYEETELTNERLTLSGIASRRMREGVEFTIPYMKNEQVLVSQESHNISQAMI